MPLTDAERAAAALFVTKHPEGGRKLAETLGVPVPPVVAAEPKPRLAPVTVTEPATVIEPVKPVRRKATEAPIHPKLTALMKPRPARGSKPKRTPTTKIPVVATDIPTIAEETMRPADERPSLTSLLATVDTSVDIDADTALDDIEGDLLAGESAVYTPPVQSTRESSTTRESWMLAAISALTPRFPADVTVPPVRVSFGWPGGRGNKTNVVGQCFMPDAVADGLPAIFVSPKQGDPVDVLETILHEMVHATGATGHTSAFGKIAGAVGLSKPWKSTPAGPELKAELAILAEQLGELPHSAVRPGNLEGIKGGAPNTQTTRMIKLTCPDDGYTVRTTRKWIALGVPACPCGTEMVPDAGDLEALGGGE